MNTERRCIMTTAQFTKMEYFRRRALIDSRYRAELWLFTLEIEQ